MTRRIRLLWVCALYFAEGLPFGLVYDALPVYFRVHGVSLVDIGLMNLLQLPWSLKVLWGPWVDRIGAPRRWIVGGLAALALWLAGLAALDASMRPWELGLALTALLACVTLTSATQDIAIDGYFVRLMPRGEEGMGNGLRVGAYRAALILGGGGTVMAAGWLPWPWIFAGVAAVFATLALLLSRAPELPSQPAQSWQEFAQALRSWMGRPGALGVFLFILLYRLGDAGMAAMVKPFWVDRGVSQAEIGLVNTTVGIGVTVVGALVGGWYTERKGIFHALWTLGLLQAFSNLGYAGVAYADIGRWGLYGASVFENFSSGLGTAAQLALLTRMCDRDQAATQYAALSALFGLTRALVGAVSGLGVQEMGFGSYFLLTFVLSFPAYTLLPQVKRRLAQ